MAKRVNKASYKARNYESASNKDVFVGLYASQVLSDAFCDLSKSQKILYIYMKLHIYNATDKHYPTPKAEYKEKELFQDNKYIFFNRHYWKDVYRLYTNTTAFYRDRDALISHGFIEIVANGKSAKLKNVYMLSDKWKDWKK